MTSKRNPARVTAEQWRRIREALEKIVEREREKQEGEDDTRTTTD